MSDANINSSQSPIIDKLEHLEHTRAIHAHGGLAYDTLKGFERILSADMERTAETGCGRSTILFSNISQHHTAFCLDDHDYGDQSSIGYFEKSNLAKPANVEWVLGPTQVTLPVYTHGDPYDCVLIDGPHGYPFPDMEYYYFYPLIKPGGILIIDDIHIPSIGRMADIIQEDAMWEFVELLSTTGVFRRTSAPLTPNKGDHWWTQDYNRRRITPDMEFYLDDGKKARPFADRASEVLGQQQARDTLWGRIRNKLFG